MTHLNTLSNIVLFTRGTKGDLYPFLRLGSGFKDRGCEVTLISNYCYENYARQEQFEFAALDDKESFEMLNNTPELHLSLSSKLKLSKEHMAANLEREVNIIGSKLELPGNSVLVAHSNDYLAPMLASEKFGVPLYLCMLAPSYVHGFTLFEALCVTLAADLNEIRARLGLHPVHDWKRWLRNFKQCFAVWPTWFSGDAQKILPDLACIGFLSIDTVEREPLQEEIREFINENTQTILITHGTSRPFNDEYFNLAINACRQLDCQLIVSTPFRTLLPDQLPENVIWVKFCSFHELLPVIDLIIHHGGIGTTREAIANSVPQLIIGQGFDRQHNGRIVKQLGLGDWLMPTELTGDVFRRRINSLLSPDAAPSTSDPRKFLLYDQDALNRFYDIITSSTQVRGDLNLSGLVNDLSKTFDDNQILMTKPVSLNESVTNQKQSDVEDVLDASNQVHNRYQLLQKMLKNRVKADRASNGDFGHGGCN